MAEDAPGSSREAHGLIRLELLGENGVAPVAFRAWRGSPGRLSGPATISVQTGAWPPGVYAARLTTDDGRMGSAPLDLRATPTEPRRQLVVMPTNTWQAYNFYDRDGDGWGDTRYAGGSPPVDLSRPFRDRGVPPRFKT